MVVIIRPSNTLQFQYFEVSSIVLAVWWSVKYYYGPNSSIFRRSRREEVDGQKTDKRKAFCFLSKRKKLVQVIPSTMFVNKKIFSSD